MGSTSFYPEEAPIHTVAVAAFAVERHPVTNAQFAEFVDDTGYVTVAERELDPALYPGANPADLVPGALVFRADGRTGGSARLAAVVGMEARRLLASSVRARQRRLGATRASGRAGGLSRRSGLRALGGTPAAERGRVGVRGPRRQHHHLCVGRRRDARRSVDGQHVAGPLPLSERRRVGLDGNIAGRHLPAQRLRPAWT